MAQPASGEDTWNSAVTYPSASLLIPIQNSKYDAQVCGSMTVRLHKASFLPCVTLFHLYFKNHVSACVPVCGYVHMCAGAGGAQERSSDPLEQKSEATVSL